VSFNFIFRFYLWVFSTDCCRPCAAVEAATHDIPDSPNRLRNSIWLLALTVAAIDTFAWLAFMSGTQSMDTTLVTALASIYSAITVLLACLLWRERLERVQWAGVVIILLRVLLAGGPEYSGPANQVTWKYYSEV